MDSSANSLINPDARMGLAGAQPGAGAAGTGQAGGAADLGGLGGNLGGNFGQRLSGLAQMRGNPRAPLIFAVALLVAIVAGLFLWSRAPDYKVLYSNLSDRDGGAIITALQQPISRTSSRTPVARSSCRPSRCMKCVCVWPRKGCRKAARSASN